MEKSSAEIPSGIRRACSSLAAGVTAETPRGLCGGEQEGESDHRGARPGAKDRKETRVGDIPRCVRSLGLIENPLLCIAIR